MDSQKGHQLHAPKAVIETCDVPAMARALDGFLSEHARRNSKQNRIEIFIQGYNRDQREIYDIPEIRLYYQQLWREYPGLLYWIDMSSPVGKLLPVLLYKPVRTHDSLSISAEDQKAFLKKGLIGLFAFCDKYNLDSKPTLWHLGQWLNVKLCDDDEEVKEWQAIGGWHPWEGVNQ